MRLSLLLLSTSVLAITPARAQTPASVTLPPAMERVLRDYEQSWEKRDAAAVAELFHPEGYALPSGQAPARGRDAIRKAYTGHGGALRLRAITWSESGPLAYIIGAYRYGERTGPDQGKFVLVLRKAEDGRWLIAADMDNNIK